MTHFAMNVLFISSKQNHSRSFSQALKRINVLSQIAHPKFLEEWSHYQSDLCFIPNSLSPDAWEHVLTWMKIIPKHVPIVVYGKIPEGLMAWSEQLRQCIILNETLSLEGSAKLIKEIITGQQEHKSAALGDNFLHSETRSLHIEAKSVRLTRKEFFLFELLSKNQGHIISRERIIDYVWDKHHYVAPNTIDVYVSRLRKKLRTLKKHWNISTIPCLGYSLEQVPSLQSV